MITLLAKIFLKEGATEAETRTAYGKICGLAGIILNVFLFAFKLFAGLISGSISIMADAMNNLSDSGSAIVTLVGFKMAAEDPDPEHPFGHGRIEYVSGFIVSLLILVMAVELIRDSVVRIIHPEEIAFSWLIIGILLVTILVKCYMAFYNHRIGNRIKSATIRAAAIDSISDCAATTVVIVATIVSHYTGIVLLDGIAGLAVGLFILKAGFQSAMDTINPLLGVAPDPEFVKQIRMVMHRQDKRITGIHDLIIHDYGPGRRIVSLHAEVPAEGDILELHDIIDNAEKDLEETLHCTATIHMDPIVTDDPRVLKLKTQVLTVLQEISTTLSMHDFRVVPGPTHTNLVFDVLMPFGFSMSEEELTDEIQNTVVTEIGDRYFCVIHYDTDYSVQMVKQKKRD
ncbi:MAG: cation diffusion facilitator family transporter [Lachnospiraceae bacterium]|nr:cation diffusion facilitator family transporter [Lachnospiraceae bacterium]